MFLFVDTGPTNKGQQREDCTTSATLSKNRRFFRNKIDPSLTQSLM